jgi:hypothetical protein
MNLTKYYIYYIISVSLFIPQNSFHSYSHTVAVYVTVILIFPFICWEATKLLLVPNVRGNVVLKLSSVHMIQLYRLNIFHGPSLKNPKNF